jgi:hypothetical protein
MDGSERESWGAWLRRECGDLPLLFAVLAFGVLLLYSESAARWVLRGGLIVYAALMFRFILAVRGDVARRAPSFADSVGNVVGLVVLGFWIWYVYRTFRAGVWVDALLVAVVVAQVAYLERLRRPRSGDGAGPVD